MSHQIFALGLPHITDTIAQHLTQTQFQQCLLVNKAWHQVFTPLFWESLTIDTNRLNILTGSRNIQQAFFHKYSRYVHHLTTVQWKALPLLGCTELKSLTLPQRKARYQRVDYNDQRARDLFFKDVMQVLKTNPRLERFTMEGFPAHHQISALELVAGLIQDRELEYLKEISLSGLVTRPPEVDERILLEVVRRICNTFTHLTVFKLNFQKVVRRDLGEDAEENQDAGALGNSKLWSVEDLSLSCQGMRERVPFGILSEFLERCPRLKILDLGYVSDADLAPVRRRIQSCTSAYDSRSMSTSEPWRIPPKEYVYALRDMRTVVMLHGSLSLIFHAEPDQMTDENFAGLLDTFPAGHLRQVQISLAIYSALTLASLNRHAAFLEDVVLFFHWTERRCPSAIQFLLSHGVNLRSIQLYDAVDRVMKLPVAEVVLGEPCVCDRMEEWALGINELPTTSPPSYEETLSLAQTTVESVDGIEYEDTAVYTNGEAEGTGYDDAAVHTNEEDEEYDYYEDEEYDDYVDPAVERREQLEDFYRTVLEPQMNAMATMDIITAESRAGGSSSSTAIIAAAAENMRPYQIKSRAIERHLKDRFSSMAGLRTLTLISDRDHDSTDCLEFALEGMERGLEEPSLKGE